MSKTAPVVALAFASFVGILVAYARPHAQRSKSGLEVGGTMLYLGMAKSEVTEKLAGHQFWKLNEDNWVVAPPEKSGPSIQFTNGRLNFADRYWPTTDNDIAEALFGAVQSLNNDGLISCQVTAGVHTDPSLNSHNVWISCGEKSVVLTRVTVGNNSSHNNMVYEQLGDRHPIK